MTVIMPMSVFTTSLPFNQIGVITDAVKTFRILTHTAIDLLCPALDPSVAGKRLREASPHRCA